MIFQIGKFQNIRGIIIALADSFDTKSRGYWSTACRTLYRPEFGGRVFWYNFWVGLNSLRFISDCPRSSVHAKSICYDLVSETLFAVNQTFSLTEAKNHCLEFDTVLCELNFWTPWLDQKFGPRTVRNSVLQRYSDTPTINELKTVDHDFLSQDQLIQLSGKTLIPNQFISHNVEPLRIWTDFKRVNISHFKQRSTVCTTSNRLRFRIWTLGGTDFQLQVQLGDLWHEEWTSWALYFIWFSRLSKTSFIVWPRSYFESRRST